jgi:hypothetical protein
VNAPDVLTPTDMDDAVGLADWMEATMLVEQRAHLSRASLRKYVRNLLSDEDPDVTVDVLLQEVERRRRACPDGYPFAHAPSGIAYTASNAALPYLFMLAISVSRPYREEHRQRDTDEFFDHLVLDALKRYLGSGCRGLRFGAPASGTRPKNFRDAIKWLAKELNLPLGRGRARPTAGDGGLDVIAWRPFRDRRSGFLIVLTQCTVQRDWAGKARDLAQDVWRGWVDLGKDPHLVLAVPFVVPVNYSKWDELSRTVHAVMDRLRLCELLEGTLLTDSDATKSWLGQEVRRITPT